MRASPSALPHAPRLSESTHIMGVICSGTRHRQQEGGVDGGQTVCVCFPVERYKYDEATAAEAAYNLSTHVCALRVGVSVCLPLSLSCVCGMCYKDIGTHTHRYAHRHGTSVSYMPQPPLCHIMNPNSVGGRDLRPRPHFSSVSLPPLPAPLPVMLLCELLMTLWILQLSLKMCSSSAYIASQGALYYPNTSSPSFPLCCCPCLIRT